MKSFLSNLNLKPREKRLIFIGIFTLTIAFIYLFIAKPLIDRQRLLDDLIMRKQKELEKMIELKGEYLALSRNLSSIRQSAFESGGKESSVFAFLEATATATGIRDALTSIQPITTGSKEGVKEIIVEFKLEKVPFTSSLKFLKSIEESDKNLFISAFRMRKRYDEPSMFDISMQVSSFASENR